MRVRLVIDIGWMDLIFGLWSCLVCRDRRAQAEDARDAWPSRGVPLVCLSVRSGFDLLLQALQLPPGSEVMMTAVTVPDMAKIAEHHRLTVIPVDLDKPQLAPSLEALERALSPKSRILVVAHLFGHRVKMDPLVRFAKQHGLYLIEDCAQAYCGPLYSGHPDADAALFSFGPIKTATALGGAALLVREAKLRDASEATQSKYCVQRRSVYMRRILKYSLLKAISVPLLFSIVLKLVRMLGRDVDSLANDVARNFSGNDLMLSVRQQPSAALLSMLGRRWRTYAIDRLRGRATLGRELSLRLGRQTRPGEWDENTYWVFPIHVQEPKRVIEKLRRAGLDATNVSRLEVVSAPAERPWLEASAAHRNMERIVFIPWHAELPRHVIRRLLHSLKDEVIGLDNLHESAIPPRAPVTTNVTLAASTHPLRIRS